MHSVPAIARTSLLAAAALTVSYPAAQAAAQEPEDAVLPSPAATEPADPRDVDVAALRQRLDALEAREAERAAEPEPESSPITFTAEPGRGFMLTNGDSFSMNIRARVQIRETFRAPNTATPAQNDPTNDFGIRTLRLWWQGYVLDPHVRYAIQLALGANDFEPGNSSPIFDAYLELTHLRDLSVRIGQFFVPFDRARTIREFTLQTVDRAQVVRELTLDRDVGVMLFSDDLFGLGGALAYRAGVFGGDGRNRIGATRLGFLFVGRISVRPFGAFDDDQEGDLARSPSPRLAIGIGVAYNQATDRQRSTTSASATDSPYVLGGFDYFHAAADVVFKCGGFSLLSEILYRSTPDLAQRVGPDPRTMGMITLTENSRQGWGFLAQMGMMLGPMFEIWARYEQMEAFANTDPRFLSTVASAGRATAGGVNCYLNGHLLKVQLDWQHSFGSDFGVGEHLVRLQLDASF